MAIAYRIAGIPAGGAKIGRAEAAAALGLKPADDAIIGYNVAGFGRVLVAAGATVAQTTGNVTKPFRGERLVIPNDVAGSFQINGLQSGSYPVMVSAAGLPARCFSEDAEDVGLQFSTIAGVAITLNAVNIAGADQNFEGMVLGYAADILG